MGLETRPPRNPLAAGCTKSFSAPRPGLLPRAQPERTRLPAVQTSLWKRSGGKPRRGAPIPGAPHRQGWRDKGTPCRGLTFTPGFQAATTQKPWQENAPAGSPLLGVGGGERPPRSHAPARRPRTSCVSVPSSRLKFPLLLPPAKRARPLARAGPEAGPVLLAARIGPAAYLRTNGVPPPALGHAPSPGAGARPLYPDGARSGIPAPSARAVPRGRRRL